jgi:hypothetical protein
MSFLFPKIQQELQKIGLMLDRRSILKAVRQIYLYEQHVRQSKETVESINHCWSLQQSVIGSLYSKEGQNEILQRLQNLQKKRNYRRKRWDVNYANK